MVRLSKAWSISGLLGKAEVSEFEGEVGGVVKAAECGCDEDVSAMSLRAGVDERDEDMMSRQSGSGIGWWL